MYGSYGRGARERRSTTGRPSSTTNVGEQPVPWVRTQTKKRMLLHSCTRALPDPGQAPGANICVARGAQARGKQSATTTPPFVACGTKLPGPPERRPSPRPSPATSSPRRPAAAAPPLPRPGRRPIFRRRRPSSPRARIPELFMFFSRFFHFSCTKQSEWGVTVVQRGAVGVGVGWIVLSSCLCRVSSLSLSLCFSMRLTLMFDPSVAS